MLARDWSKRLTLTNIPLLKPGEYPRIFCHWTFLKGNADIDEKYMFLIINSKSKKKKKNLKKIFQFFILFSHSPFPIPHLLFLTLHFSFLTLHFSFLTLHSSFLIPHSSFTISYSPFSIPHSPIPHSSFSHSTFPILHSRRSGFVLVRSERDDTHANISNLLFTRSNYHSLTG